jgi:hypothetical protein
MYICSALVATDMYNLVYCERTSWTTDSLNGNALARDVCKTRVTTVVMIETRSHHKLRDILSAPTAGLNSARPPLADDQCSPPKWRLHAGRRRRLPPIRPPPGHPATPILPWILGPGHLATPVHGPPLDTGPWPSGHACRPQDNGPCLSYHAGLLGYGLDSGQLTAIPGCPHPTVYFGGTTAWIQSIAHPRWVLQRKRVSNPHQRRAAPRRDQVPRTRMTRQLYLHTMFNGTTFPYRRLLQSNWHISARFNFNDYENFLLHCHPQ